LWAIILYYPLLLHYLHVTAAPVGLRRYRSRGR
jgi:hypothetical protein